MNAPHTNFFVHIRLIGVRIKTVPIVDVFDVFPNSLHLFFLPQDLSMFYLD